MYTGVALNLNRRFSIKDIKYLILELTVSYNVITLR